MNSRPVSWLNSQPCALVCPACARHVITKIEVRFLWYMMLLFLLFGFIGLIIALILAAKGYFNRFIHTCPLCSADLTNSSKFC